MDWTTEAIERLKALWAEGHSTAEIGRRMGISKNAVCGKAGRLGLPERPSPIKRNGGARPRPAPRVFKTPRSRSMPPAPLPAPLPVVQVPFGPPEPTEQRYERLRVEEQRRYVNEAFVVPQPPRAFSARPSPRRLGARSCQWPIGEPGTEGFRFCGGDPLSGKPYCTEHAAVAYVKPRDRRADAAD